MDEPLISAVHLFLILFIIPILAYFVVKAGMCGYYSAKRIWGKHPQEDNEDSEQKE